MEFSAEQLKAIETRDHNLLVSAAAGSGKTAVLIERIMQRILDENDPAGVDSLVVVTFTKAAAAEMKSRLARRLNDEIEKATSENRRPVKLIRQLSLIDNAKISTIDSFCGYIVRNYYNTIGLDPSYRVGDEGELKLLQADIIDELLEERFASGDDGFARFVDIYGSAKELTEIGDVITRIYSFSQSNPWPKDWLDSAFKAYETESAEEYARLPVVQATQEFAQIVCASLIEEFEYLKEECEIPDGPLCYLPTLDADIEVIQKACNATSLTELVSALNNKFPTLASRKDCNPDLAKIVQDKRTALKKKFTSIKERYFEDIEAQIEELKACREYAHILKDLVEDFGRRYASKKEELNIADFNDVAHYALRILVNHTEEGDSLTKAALEMAAQIDEVYIDEYQDSNPVQEILLSAISQMGEKKVQNRFMVGDVKQSIYGFRMARPAIFMERYDEYSKNPEAGIKIELHNNYRSRPNVLACVNDIFRMSMKRFVGGVEYTKDVELNPGSKFEDEVDDVTDVIVAAGQLEEELDCTKPELHAHIAAYKIIEMRKADPTLKYSDFAILDRNINKFGSQYCKILAQYDIPYAYDSSSGYYSAFEICQVLDMLRIIDNPRQDIALAAALKSFYGGFTLDEIAKIRGRRKKSDLYDCVSMYQSDKTNAFIDMINSYRELSKTNSISEILNKLIYETGYYDFAGALNSGKKKQANLKMLINKAKEFEKTSYSGVFNFLRYIDKLEKYEVEYGDSNVVSENDDAVRLMTIHKSKGLEFPIVILTQADKDYNSQYNKSNIVYSSDYGVALSYADVHTRAKKATSYKKMMIDNKIKRDQFGEELRVLYVALTRAERKLVIIGNASSDKEEIRWELDSKKTSMPVVEILDNKNYMRTIMPAAIRYQDTGRFRIKHITLEELVDSFEKPMYDQGQRLLERFISAASDYNEDEYARLEAKLTYTYPYSQSNAIKTKYSVSEIKHRAMEENDNLEEKIVAPEDNKPIPEFIRPKDKIDQTVYGNAYHKFFELMDYVTPIENQLVTLVERHKLTKAYADIIRPDKIYKFLNSDVGKLMSEAQHEGRLFREQPFTIQIPAKKVSRDTTLDEPVLVQGIIDAFILDKDEAIVIDYKTDAVSLEELVERYKTQLNLYRDAVGQITGMTKVKCYIYSVKHSCGIEI